MTLQGKKFQDTKTKVQFENIMLYEVHAYPKKKNTRENLKNQFHNSQNYIFSPLNFCPKDKSSNLWHPHHNMHTLDSMSIMY